MEPPASASSGRAEERSGWFVMIDRELNARPVRLIDMTPHVLRVMDEHGATRRHELREVLGLMNPDAPMARVELGEIRFADGQRLPGMALVRTSGEENTLLWTHPRLRQLRIPLDGIRSVVFIPGGREPEPGLADAVRLTNGDRLEGFLVSVGEAITIETNDKELVRVPLERVESVSLVTSGTAAAQGARLWLNDGTIMDVRGLTMSDDGIVRLQRPLAAPEVLEQLHPLAAVRGILFDPAALVPLSRLTPTEISGPASRYVIPPPMVMEDDAPLGLGRLRFDGPTTVRYRQPAGAARFAAEAVLPDEARAWGHCELVILDDDREVFRAVLHRHQPRAAINVALSGSELTVRLTEGDRGPILDRVMLHRPAFLVETDRND